MKGIPKTNILFNLYHLPSSTVLDRKANTSVLILKQLRYFSYFCFKFPFFRFFCVQCILCSMFCISSDNLNSISCGICLSVKSRHLKLFSKMIIELSSIGIFLGLWLTAPPCNFTKELFSCTVLHGCFQSFNQ